MKHILFLVLSLCFICTTYSQDKYFTKTGKAYFMSHTDVIDIDGTNNQVFCVLETQTGNVACAMLIKAFEFTLATASEHFNETYMESHLYPKANFKGKIAGFDMAKLSSAETKLTAEGQLTIHGKTKNVSLPVVVSLKDGVIVGSSNFKVSIADYDIKVPKVVENRVAKIVDVKINLELKAEKK
ncbi:MAG TPA: YceI family protein [Bacteroidales bacterium]|nr:YceI family protein [Bacteroidales bacterium]